MLSARGVMALLRTTFRQLARPLLFSRGCASETTPRKRSMNLLELLATLPERGVGAKVYRESWVRNGWLPEDHHYVVKSVQLKPSEKDGKLRGQAIGSLIWKGVPHKKPSHPGKGQVGPRVISSGPKRGEWTAIVDGATFPSRVPRAAAEDEPEEGATS